MGVDRNKTKIPMPSRSSHFGRKRLTERESMTQHVGWWQMSGGKRKAEEKEQEQGTLQDENRRMGQRKVWNLGAGDTINRSN